MSTVINNGYRIRSGTPLTHFVRSLDGCFSNARHAMIHKAMAKIMVTIEDEENYERRIERLKFRTNDMVDFSHPKYSKGTSAIRFAKGVLGDLNRELQKPGVRRNPTLDINFAVYFVGDPKDVDTQYALVVTEQKEYIEVWESIECVEEFSYWDSHDHPETLTRKEWKERAATWDRAIGSNPIGLNSVRWDMPLEMQIWSLDVDESLLASNIADVRLQNQAALEWYLRTFGKPEDESDTIAEV